MEYAFIIWIGLLLGSFAGATVWRLRARQLIEDQAEGERVPKSELKKLTPLIESGLLQDRSRCLHCQHTLEWYDLVPIVSWLSTRGRCRYCSRSIGRFEPLIEIGTAGLLLALYWGLRTHGITTSPNPLIDSSLYTLWLGAGVLLAIAFAYDAKWFLLPDRVIFPLIAVSGVIAAMRILEAPVPIFAALDTLGAVLILSGLYLVLWYVSKGKWVGFGDVKLGLALGLALGSWTLAFLALFLANLIGTLVVLPDLTRGKVSKKTQIPFGPLLIAGFVIALLWGNALIDAYTQAMNGFTSVLLML